MTFGVFSTILLTMTFEEESVKFLEDHIDNSFAHIMGNQLMDNLEWLEQPEYRPFAYMCDHDEPVLTTILHYLPLLTGPRGQGQAKGSRQHQ